MLSGVEIKRGTFLDSLLLEYHVMKQMAYVSSILLLSPYCVSPDVMHDMFLKTALPYIDKKDTLEEAFDKHFGKK